MKTEQIRPAATWRLSSPPRKLLCDSCLGSSLGICRPLDDQRLAQLLAMGGRRRWSKREFMYRTDEPARTVYKITKGIVAESRTLDDGRRQIIGIRTVGDLCGYPEHRGRYLFCAEALTEVEACAFDGEKFVAFIGRDIDLACALAEDVSDRLRRATRNLTVIGQLKSTERVAHFLVEIHELYVSRHICTHPLTLHLTRQEIADYLGLTLETVSRSFSRLRDMRLIALVGGDAVAILDEDRLSHIAKV
ncbi:MAG: Crp/Fnr family transcriptional regulator [Reyranella sp.]|nr:Crp/Fnr family transcriptional regulator [Reyranella sp.]MBN9086547.1 Crp/Fnr family transcriptional regulator [Reyranella sp.]